MIRGKFQEGIRTMFNFHVRRNSTDSPNTLSGSQKWVDSSPRSSSGSPRTDVGEIDTSAPFQSVKAAVSLFGEAGTSPKAAKTPTNKPTPTHLFINKKPKTTTDERVLEKETQIHLALKELDELKERLKTIEYTKAQAFRDLEKANRTLQELTNKLEIISESKQTAFESTEEAKERAKELEDQKSIRLQGGGDAWKQDVDNERELYKASSVELISAKQELTIIRQDFDVVLEAKLAAFQEAADAQHITQLNQGRVALISNEITTMRETLEQVKLATLEAQEEQNQINADRQARFQSHATAKELVDTKIKSLKEEYDPQPRETLQEKLEGTMEAIELLQEQLNSVRDSDMSSLKNATAELGDATKELQEIVEEEQRGRASEDLLRLELDNMKRDHSELKNKSIEAESRAESLQGELEICKAQLNAGQIDSQELCDDMHRKLQVLESESENARTEAEEIKKNIELVRQDTETARIAAEEAENRLKIALNELEEAKAAERHAGDMIHTHGPQDTSSMSNNNNNNNNKIKLSVEEFESLSKKAEESSADADLKVATAMAQIELINASENEALKKLEAFIKEKEAIETAIEDALKQAEMAEGAKQVVEGELMKWREKEEN